MLDAYGKHGLINTGEAGSLAYQFTRDYGASWSSYAALLSIGTIRKIRITDAGIYCAADSGIYVCRD